VDAAEPRPAPAPAGGGGAIGDYFKFGERGTTLGTEVRAGLTTFMVMAYIIFLNPAILAVTNQDGQLVGPPPVPTAAATALLAGLITIAMGLIGNVPIALAAGLGINAIVAFNLILTRGLSWQGAMGVIFWEGLVILILVLVGLREAMMNAVPLVLKKAIAVGIGLFILFIGFVNAGLIASPPGGTPPVSFVYPTQPAQFLAIGGLLLTIALYVRRIPGALLLGILITTLVGIPLGVTQLPASVSDLFVAPDFSNIGQLNVTEVFELGALTAVLIIFAIMILDFFDTMGTVTAVGEQAGLTDDRGQVPGVGRILLVDSAAAALGGIFGTSSNTSYIESSAGVSEGGRTGFTAVVVGVLFLLGVFLAPLAGIIPSAATSPALIIVGALLFEQITDIDARDIEQAIPALLTMILMPLTFDIAIGIGAGVIAWVFIKLVMGKVGEIHWLMWGAAIAFLVFFLKDWIEPIVNASV
jgi:AGZA family xanthine/uracil permease-like MFS transporter